jgi:hypothetical protein
MACRRSGVSGCTASASLTWVQQASTSSTAPLQTSRAAPPPGGCSTTDMRRRWKSKGTSSSLVQPAQGLARSPRASSARSIGFFSPVWCWLLSQAQRSAPSSGRPQASVACDSAMWSCVSVPVLSVHSTSMAPRFWIASSRLTMTCRRAMATAPLARVLVTIIGSISGVSPTATDSANRKASSQLPWPQPLNSSTSGTITAISRSSRRLTWLMPASNWVGARSVPAAWPASVPKKVRAPVATTSTVAEPETTLVPMKTRLSAASGSVTASSARACFSTGRLSPVMAAWLTNRSLAASTRASAGTMSPADRATTSPGTSRAIGSSRAPGRAAARWPGCSPWP